MGLRGWFLELRDWGLFSCTYLDERLHVISLPRLANALLNALASALLSSLPGALPSALPSALGGHIFSALPCDNALCLIVTALAALAALAVPAPLPLSAALAAPAP